jgi:hypothetical protein
MINSEIMPGANGTDRANLTHLLCAAGGVLAGAWWVKNETEQAKRSRAEVDDPALVEDVCEDVGDVLDAWEPDPKCECEDDFTRDLAAYLTEATDWDIEVCPETSQGQPDILIQDVLALELKVDPNKSERDRCIGQCAGYSREWVTWIVLIDAEASKVGVLERLLAAKGLDHLLVWNFAD